MVDYNEWGVSRLNKQDTTGLTKLDVRVISGYYKPETGWGFFDVELLNTKDASRDDVWTASSETAKITGTFERKFFQGEEYIMYGAIKDHPKYGQQWVVQFVQAKFDTPERIKSFLYQCAARNVIDQLVQKYEGQDIVKLILDNQVEYSDIKGMGDHRFNALREKVVENEQMKDVIIGLSKYGITPNQMKKICLRFGARAVQAIEENPYNLCKIKGIGFQKADDIAKNMGFDMDSPFRIREGIRYILTEAMGEGNSWLLRKELLSVGMETLGIKDTLISEQLSEIEDVVEHEDKYALLKVYKAEKYIAERLKEMDKAEPLNFDVESFIQEQEENNKDILPNGFTEEQKQFFYNIKKCGVNFLIGYAGTGKSFLLQFALKIFKSLSLSYLLCAPTGKASKVMEEYTNEKASTIHRAFKIFGREDDDDQDSKFGVYFDDIVMDECSMLGVLTLEKALRGIKNKKTRIIFIGDDFQIPSVEVGNFLHDAIDCGVFHITKLTKVFRQDEGGVIDTATKIRLGESYVDNDFEGVKEFGKDMTLHCCDPEYTASGAIYYYKKALKLGYTPDDIIVLSPTKKGPKGTKALDNEIQKIVNPPDEGKNEVSYGMDTIFREGDRIINTQNQYNVLNVNDEEVDIMNGDMGVITEIDNVKKQATIDYGKEIGKVVTPFNGLEAIMHSYSLTIHKSQGSGFKIVILLVDHSHQYQLNANLIYTGKTRTKKHLYLIGQANIINRSAQKNISMERNSFLKEFFQTT